VLIMINDDSAYVSWISRHRQGFVIDAKAKPKINHLTLHRATCSVIKPHKRGRLTTGVHIKACSSDAAELVSWALEQSRGGLMACSECQPDHEEPALGAHPSQHTLTRLGRDVLSYVLDWAVMYLDGAETDFHATIENAGLYVDKTVAQVMPVIRRLIDEGYLECDRPTNTISLAATVMTYPTAKALRTIPAFGALSDENLTAELNQLRSGRRIVKCQSCEDTAAGRDQFVNLP